MFSVQLATGRNGDLTRWIALKAEVWVGTVTKGGWRFMTTWRKYEGTWLDIARGR